MSALKDSRPLLLAVLLAVPLGCSHDKPAIQRAGRAGDVASTAGTAREAPAIRIWDDELGAILSTPSVEHGTPLLFSRDTALRADIEVELFSHDSRTIRATLRPGPTINGCARERSAAFGATADQRPPAWSLALMPNTATPLAVDAVGELAPRDSTALIVRINQLVSAVPEDSASAPFHGLPIVVRDAWRFSLSDSTPVIVAIAARSLNTESNPRAQVLTIIAEPDAAAGAGAWRTAWVRSETGAEDRLEGADLLAALTLRSARAVIAIQRETDAGQQVDIVDRTGPSEWRLRWSTATLPCSRP